MSLSLLIISFSEWKFGVILCLNENKMEKQKALFTGSIGLVKAQVMTVEIKMKTLISEYNLNVFGPISFTLWTSFSISEK